MRKIAIFGLILAGFRIASPCLEAQTVKVVPAGTAQVAVGATFQFSAQVTGLSSTAVAWSVQGVTGGNSTYGTISAAGLYQAPASLPAQNPVQIVAKSTANPGVKGSAYVYLLGLGPAITAVSPNPMPVGNITVTIQGSGLVDGAEVMQTYGSFSGIQLVTTRVTATSVTATGYQGPAASASFCVKNPGTICGNSISVPVGGSTPPAKYTLTVVSGSGSGSYAAGTVVSIKANTPPAGQQFVNWTGAAVANPNASSTTFTMPSANATVTANYAAGPTYALTVVNGTGSGSYAAGTLVSIKANTPPAGQQFVNWTGATVANANASSTTLTMPSANATVTANYAAGPTYALTVVNGSGSGSYAAGIVVPITANAPPAGQMFVNWTGAAVANASASSTTITMPAATTTVTANYGAAPAIPYPVATHPRIWITQQDLPRLRGWAVSTNPIYQQGILPLLNQAINIYQTQFFPNGAANPNYPDPGDVQGYTGYLTEQYGAVLAFHSLIDPNPSNRILYAQYTRNLLMYAMNQAALGHLANAPFRDPAFAIYNRANGSGEQWPLMVDWIYSATDAQGNPILTASDKATIRNVFMMWANDCLNASTTGGDHPSPVGVTNSLQLLPNNLPYRMAANNYYLGHARLLTMMALSIDPGDDPPLNSSAPGTQIGNTLRSYILDANGAWLYQMYAMFGEPAAVAGAYGVSGTGAGFGLASGGLPPEGMLYGHSYAFILGQLLALQTAGFNNLAYAGPQIQMIGTPMWDRYVTGYLSSLTPAAQTFPSESWLGPVYQFGSYGDLLRLYVTPDFMQPFSLLALLDQENGKTSHLSAARWFVVNGTQGGAGALMSRITDPWSWSSTQSLLYFMLLDPAAPAAPDPRPTYPTMFFDPAAGRVVAHSDWTPNGTMFDYRASWISINHQLGDGGQFELYRKGEWLTKEMSNYDNNAQGMTTMYHNTLALKNYAVNGTPANLQWYEAGEWANGSQWMEGMDAGDPTTVSSSGPGYVYASSNLAPLFNRPDVWSPNDAAINVTQATRSILWLNNDYIVVYDRATTANPGLFKRFNLSLVTNPAISGNVAAETLASGQQLFVQTLLPLSHSASAVNAAGNLNPIAELEPARYILTVQDPSNPNDTRFLHLLQGADAGAAMAPATYLQSTSGTAFDGAVFGASAVYFPVNGNGAFSGTSVTAPAGVTTVFVTGLAPNASYGYTSQPSGSGKLITLTPGTTGATTDSAGVVRLTSF